MEQWDRVGLICDMIQFVGEAKNGNVDTWNYDEILSDLEKLLAELEASE